MRNTAPTTGTAPLDFGSYTMPSSPDLNIAAEYRGTIETIPIAYSRKYRCHMPRCNAEFYERRQIDLHNELAHERYYHCPGCAEPACSKSFTEMRSLWRHTDRRLFPCPDRQCEYSTRPFKRKDYLDKHIRRQHQSREFVRGPVQQVVYILLQPIANMQFGTALSSLFLPVYTAFNMQERVEAR